MWVFATVAILIVLLNMLIAIMSDTFERVQENSESSMLKEVASIMQENSFLVNRYKMFRNFRYILVV